MLGSILHQALPTPKASTGREPALLLQSGTHLAAITQHVTEVKGIHAILFMGRGDCVGLTRQQGQPANCCPQRYFLLGIRESRLCYASFQSVLPAGRPARPNAVGLVDTFLIGK
jgi:hypothetical protein